MNIKTSIYFMLCCLPLLVACGNNKQEMPGEKYKTLAVALSNQTLQSDYPATLRGRQAVEVRPQSAVPSQIYVLTREMPYAADKYCLSSTRFHIGQHWKQRWQM